MVGGVGNSVHELVSRLRELNNQVSVLTPGLDRFGVEDGVWRVPALFKFEREWGDIFFCPSTYKALHEIETDIIHTHTPRKFLAEFVTLCNLFNRKRFPYIVSLRLLNTSLPFPMNRFSDLYRRTVERIVFRNAETVVVQTKTNKRILERTCRIAPEKIRIIPNGVDTTLFDPSRYNQDALREKYAIDKEKTIVFTGRLTTQKGLYHLFDSIAQINREMSSVQFVIVGTGPQEQELKALSKSLHTEKNIKFLGEMNHDTIAEAYSMGDAFVLPSLSESFPNVMLEAMAMQKPIIATKVGVIPEILENRKTAMLIQPANATELTKAILEVLTDDKLARDLGKNAKELVHKDYTWSRVVNETLDMYDHAINRN